MKKIALFTLIFCPGCFNDTSDLRDYVNHIAINTQTNISHNTRAMPAITIPDHFVYSSQTLTSPFIATPVQTGQKKVPPVSGCLSPAPERKKQALEKYPLSNLQMRGTIENTVNIWALIAAPDQKIHKVSINSFIGLNHGRVTAINQNSINIVELISNATGCWMETETMIRLSRKMQKDE